MNAPIVPQLSRIPIKSRIISISSRDYFQGLAEFKDRDLAKIMNDGNAFFFKTKADGSYDVEVIIINKEELIRHFELDDELMDRSTPAVIKLGQIGEVGDITLLGGEYSFKFQVTPGNYLVRVFFTGNDVEFYGFKIVLLATTQEAKNNFLLIDSLK